MTPLVTTLDNGLCVIVEEMPHLESAAYELLIPGGITTDLETRRGESLVLAELVGRGAGGKSSKDFSDAFDGIGARHGEFSGMDRYVLRGALVADKLSEALSLVSEMVLAPTLLAEEVPSIQEVLLHDIASLVDNPTRRAMVELSERYYPSPWGRSSYGTEEGIMAVTPQSLKLRWEREWKPKGSILTVAGNVKAAQVLNDVQRCFGGWKGEAVEIPKFGTMLQRKYHHIPFESAQEQIAFMFPSAPFGTPYYYAAYCVAQVLSGGMFGRLFIEVREKRGLCYTVFCRFSGNPDYGTVSGYAGTTPERAHETLDVIRSEFQRVKGTVTDEELSRAKANLKAALIMNEESPGSRAGGNAWEYRYLGRIRSIQEIHDAIESVTKNDMDTYLDLFPSTSMAILTLGPREFSGM